MHSSNRFLFPLKSNWTSPALVPELRLGVTLVRINAVPLYSIASCQTKFVSVKTSSCRSATALRTANQLPTPVLALLAIPAA